MNKDELRNQTLSSEKPQRELVVSYLRLLSNKAKELPLNEREARGDYQNPANKFPQTKGEDIASDISSCLAQQEWVTQESEPLLEEIGTIAGNLEINPGDAELWQELFVAVEKLDS